MENQNNDSKKSSVVLIVIITVLITALVVGGGVYWWQKSDVEETEKAKKEEKIEEPKLEEEEAKEEEKTEKEKEKEKIEEEPEEIEKPEETEKSPEPEEDKTADWESYTNKEYGFSFSYPKNFQLIENGLFGRLDRYIEDPILFRVKLIQDIYPKNAQSPEINLEIAKTEKTINQVLDRVKEEVNENAEALEDPQSPYYGADPPEIESIETETIGGLEAVKVVHYLGPGGPNPMLLEYYMTYQGYIFVFSANYSANCDPSNIGDCGATEKETLPILLSTLKFIE